MPVTLNKVLRTPAQVAGAVLDNIAANPDGLDMSTWSSIQAGDELAPADDLCGTTLCAAGWIAHLTGWTIVFSEDEVVLNDRWGKPDDSAYLYAEKNGERRLIESVAEEALKIGHREHFWLASEEEALRRLREIAGRA